MANTIAKKEVFELDSFQKEAIKVIQDGKSVVVCAPTGAGKTVIAKEAIKMALASGHKVFYTAPLKALINQKYYEFCAQFGEELVGIITGDTNKNRDAQIIVMTTEIYRNMLYGTTFGSIDPFLKELKYLIFDEFHYINDPSRGTVWEESVIYSPKSIQVLALSATINNPEELVEWIEDIHGECGLVFSNFRPVPLHHYFFKDDKIAPLLTSNGKLNPQLREHDDNRFGKKQGKFRHGHSGSNAKVSIANVVMELYRKQMLPAIYFVFSRKGCDKAAQEVSDLNLLTKEEAAMLNGKIDLAIATNSHLKNFGQLDLLRKGIAAHHAGMLPQVKSLIEELFTEALIKVVFSTETLAAGINMPARSTVISNINKVTDSGFRNLSASEFLQISGRAGRRGMDESGYVVTVKGGNYNAAEVALLANSKPEDVTSHFRSSYEMVLNLIQNHKYEDIKDLVERSFGQLLIRKNLVNDQKELKRLDDQVRQLQHPLCPGEIGDLNYYREMQSKLDQTRRQKQQMEKNLDSSGVDDLEGSLEILTMETKNYPCNGCPKQKPCSKQTENIKRYRKQSRALEQRILDVKNMQWQSFEATVELLQSEGYIDKNYQATDLGRTCASFRTDNSFFVTELLRANSYANLSPKQFAGMLSLITIGASRARDKSFAHISQVALNNVRKIETVARRVIQKQRQFGLDKPVEVNPNISALIEDWASGMSWEDLIKNSFYDEGDILRGIRRTVDLSKQISKAPSLDPAIQNLASEAVMLLERDIVLETV